MVWNPNLNKAHLKREVSQRSGHLSLLRSLRDIYRFLHLDISSAGQVVRGQFPQYIPIASKLALAITGLITLGMLVVGGTLGANQSRLLEVEMNRFALTMLKQMSGSSKEPLLAEDQFNLEMIAHGLTKHSGILGAAIYDDEGVEQVATGQKLSLKEEVISAYFSKNNNPDNYVSIKSNGDKNAEYKAIAQYLYPIVFRDLKVGYVMLTIDQSTMIQARRDTVWTVALVTSFMVLLGMVVAIYLSKWMTRPIDDIVNAGKAISEGHYDFKLKERRNDELGFLMDSMNSMGKGLLQKKQVEEVFSRYVSPQVAKQAIKDLGYVETVKLGGHHIDASVLFADIVGFTSLSERLPAEEVSNLLNYYFSLIDKAVSHCNGYIDKYMGDCAMIVFGVPYETDDHRYNSLCCAWMILRLVERINLERVERGLEVVEFRVGANSGTMLAGNIGSADRMEYTVVGDAVNLASRLSHAGGPGEAIFTSEVKEHDSIGKRVIAKPQGEIKLRGKSNPSKIFSLVDVGAPLREKILLRIEEIVVAEIE